ncbi:MAG: hypothetical protein A3A08_01720 [Candidatus Nealsonbacteria bacterium RIFCSPLOWO2_01_FULL_41_9]|uniref:Uncharacterized protein n=1 Tax=Candidatus Nealsonbacteria bacterium RIFCSPLOWO2_01_FULL_41_9 TaxID=1801671 RepID=A0A1G2EDF1_9BACT|nr:MAG: hypothetical protein A3A08_01720 [Candidatus Nealsonbacteria bacterium RIFCSPLOWO2_01_FULL_41_9]
MARKIRGGNSVSFISTLGIDPFFIGITDEQLDKMLLDTDRYDKNEVDAIRAEINRRDHRG